MAIEWFPGHMATARREAVKTMQTTDVVIEVLDARVPFSSCSPMIEELRRENQRPSLKVLNKIDAADPKRTEEWLAHYNALPKTKAIGLSATEAKEVARIPKECLGLAPGRGTQAEAAAADDPRHSQRREVDVDELAAAATRRERGHEPAITKNQQRHTLSPTSWIVDTPGMLWPAIDQTVALKLAVTHSIGRNAYDEETAALELARLLLRDYPGLLAKRFGALPEGCDAHGLLAHVAAARSIAVDGIAKAAAALLNDFRSEKLGRITLESVDELPRA